jgi:hypothetical protein
VQKQKEAPADRTAAFYGLLDQLLTVSRQDIQEAFKPGAGATKSPTEDRQSQEEANPARLSRTDTSD